MLLFNLFSESSEIAYQRYPLIKATLVKANGILFTHGSIFEYTFLMEQFHAALDNHIGRVTAKFRIQGPEIASSLCAATFDFESATVFLTRHFRDQEGLIQTQLPAYQSSGSQKEASLGEEDTRLNHTSMIAYWTSLGDTSEVVRANPCPVQGSDLEDLVFLDSEDAAAYACQSLGETTSVVSQRIGDKNILPYMHVILAYLFGPALVPNALIYIEGWLPWQNIVIFLNILGRSGVIEAHITGGVPSANEWYRPTAPEGLCHARIDMGLVLHFR